MTVVAVANIVAILSVAFILWKREESFWRNIYGPALALKLFCGIALGLLYTYYYTVGDTFTYHKDGIALANMARHNVQDYLQFLWNGNDTHIIWKNLYLQEPRAVFMSKITSIFCLLSHDNYWVVSIHLSFIAFLSTWFLVKQLSRIDAIAGPAIVAFLFFPSAVFWSSGVIKESIAMASLYYLAAVFLKAWMQQPLRIIHWLLLPVALWLLWALKYYYLAVLLPVVVTTLVVKLVLVPRIPFRHWAAIGLLWFMVFAVPLFVATTVHPNFYPERFMGVIVENYKAFAAASPPEDRIVYEHLQPRIQNIALYAPKALVSGLFRPFIGEAHNAMQMLVALENLVVLALFIATITRLRNAVAPGYRLLVVSASVYIVMLCIFLALSTPNFGTLSRYKVGFQSFFVLLILINNPLFTRLQTFAQRSLR
ncbi:MAG TPA: hypothetical protein VIM75_15170 [Ohtaekwangia sp.]|uniref:hypothetical protein n=1 Tax=Ohtaekwangia sp. TaxID=2066019 RepID=UPI002F920D4D